MYKVYKFKTIEDYIYFAEVICKAEWYKIVSVNKIGEDIVVTVYKEEISGY